MSFFVAELDDDFSQHSSIIKTFRELGICQHYFVGSAVFGPELHRLREVETKYNSLLTRSMCDVACGTDSYDDCLPLETDPTLHLYTLDMKPLDVVIPGSHLAPICLSDDEDVEEDQTYQEAASEFDLCAVTPPESEHREDAPSPNTIQCALCRSALSRLSHDVRNNLLNHSVLHIDTHAFGHRYECGRCGQTGKITAMRSHQSSTGHEFTDRVKSGGQAEYHLECARLFSVCFPREQLPAHFQETLRRAEAGHRDETACELCSTAVSSSRAFDHSTTHVSGFGARFRCAECDYGSHCSDDVTAHREETGHHVIDRTDRAKDAEFVRECARLFSLSFPALTFPARLTSVLHTVETETIETAPKDNTDESESEDALYEESSDEEEEEERKRGKRSARRPSGQCKRAKIEAAQHPCQFPGCSHVLRTTSAYTFLHLQHAITHIDNFMEIFGRQCECKECDYSCSGHNVIYAHAKKTGHRQFTDRSKEGGEYSSECARVFSMCFPACELPSRVARAAEGEEKEKEEEGMDREDALVCKLCSHRMTSSGTSIRTRLFNHACAHLTSTIRFKCSKCSYATNKYEQIKGHRNSKNHEWTDRSKEDDAVRSECHRLFSVCYPHATLPGPQRKAASAKTPSTYRTLPSSKVTCQMCSDVLTLVGSSSRHRLFNHASLHLEEGKGTRFECRDCEFTHNNYTLANPHKNTTGHRIVDRCRESKEVLSECARLFATCFPREEMPRKYHV